MENNLKFPMKQSRTFIHTLREMPKDADVVSQQLMLRAGMISKVAAGIYNYLPLALRSIRKVEQIVREELERDGCQELLMPMVQPAELWQESGRWSFYGKELLRCKDRKDADFCLGPTHEEVITAIVRDRIRSYRQLPMNLFQIQDKFRDEIRPRFGLIRGREFIMKDGYSFHTNDQDANREYWVMFNAYKRIFSRLGIKYRTVEADSGAIGGSFTHEFHVLAGSGEDAILSCNNCDYTSNNEKTEAPQLPNPHAGEKELFLHKAHFHTPGITKMEEQAKAFKDETIHGLSLDHASKFYLYRASKGAESWDVGLLLRSDHEPNTTKLKNQLAVDFLELVPLAEAEALAGASSGFIGPVELDIPVYADRSLQGVFNLTCGANRDGYHHFGFKPERDIKQFHGFFDLRLAGENDTCCRCGKGIYQAFRGIEVGQVFKLGSKYSQSMNCVFQDEQGQEQPMIMGCYGIGITRTVAAVIEQNYDVDGIIWPWPVAPYHLHILALDAGNPDVLHLAERLEKELIDRGIEVLLDDRDGTSPGVKFKDADLLGFPLRLTIGARGLKEGIVELRDRRSKEVSKHKPEEIVHAVLAAKERMLNELEASAGR
jgi:prolyl-tRNA synthetase